MRSCNLNTIFIIRCLIFIPAVSYYNAVNVGLTICINTSKELATVYTSKLTVNKLICVTCCLNNCTPINYRVTNLAEGSTGVSCLCTCCCLIVNSYGSMNVCCASLCLKCRIRECTLKLCINAEFLVRECAENIRSITVNISNFTHINVNLYVIRPEAICVPIGFCGIVWITTKT